MSMLLRESVKHGNAYLLKFLLSRPGISDVVSHIHTELLCASVKHPSWQYIFEILLDYEDSHSEIVSRKGSVMESAVAHGVREFVKILLERPDAEVTRKSIIRSAQNGDPVILKLLLDHPMAERIYTRPNLSRGRKYNPLCEAVKYGNTEAVRVLLSYSFVGLHEIGSYGRCKDAIYRAVQYNQEDIAKLLLEREDLNSSYVYNAVSKHDDHRYIVRLMRETRNPDGSLSRP
eukprot:737571_1